MNIIEINGDYFNMDLIVAIEETSETGFSIKFSGHDYILTYENEKIKKYLFKWLHSKAIGVYEI